jgi:hypothetical protein
LPEVWSQCERSDWLMWLLNKAGYTWNPVTWNEYIRIIIIASVWDEYEHVRTNAIRSLIPYPFNVKEKV